MTAIWPTAAALAAATTDSSRCTADAQDIATKDSGGSHPARGIGDLPLIAAQRERHLPVRRSSLSIALDALILSRRSSSFVMRWIQAARAFERRVLLEVTTRRTDDSRSG
jgi:hypothetical protein